MTVVLDASALLALMHGEPGAEAVNAAAEGAAISAVNWSEVWQRSLAAGADTDGMRADLEAFGVSVAPFDADLAEATAELRAPTRRFGLSLADRACLALGIRLGRTILTADHRWVELQLGVVIQAIR